MSNLTRSMMLGKSSVNDAYTYAQLSALAAAGGLTPNSWYVAADSGVRYWAPDASTLQSDPPPAQASAESGRTILWDYERDGTSGFVIVASSCTISGTTLNGVPCAKLTGTGVATIYVNITLPGVSGFTGGLGIDCASERANGTQLTVRVGLDSAVANYASASVNPTAASNTSAWTYNDLQEYAIQAFPGGSPADSGFSYGGTWSPSGPTYPTEVAYAHVRVANVGGQIPVMYVRRVYSIAPRVSRVAIVLDDGYASAYRLLKPVLESRKLRATWAIIPSEIDGTATFMKWRDIGRLFDQGHEIVTHGNLGVNVAADLSAFMAQFRIERQAIRDQGFATARSDRCYVWPGGNHQYATNDTTYRDAMRADGIVIARSAMPLQQYSFTADTWPDRLTLPIIGHTQKASSGLEATNIADMVSRINNAALFGTDVILMLHAGVASTDTNWGSNGTLNIRTNDLATICDAIRTNVIAGTQQSVLFGELA